MYVQLVKLVMLKCTYFLLVHYVNTYLFFPQGHSRPPLAWPPQHMHTPYMTNRDECHVEKEYTKKKIWRFAHLEPTPSQKRKKKT